MKKKKNKLIYLKTPKERARSIFKGLFYFLWFSVFASLYDLFKLFFLFMDYSKILNKDLEILLNIFAQMRLEFLNLALVVGFLFLYYAYINKNGPLWNKNGKKRKG